MVRPLSVDPDGTSLLVCRYVCPTPLPPVLQQAVAAAGAGAGGVGGISATETVMLKVGGAHVFEMQPCAPVHIAP